MISASYFTVPVIHEHAPHPVSLRTPGHTEVLEGTEAQRGQRICPQSHSKSGKPQEELLGPNLLPGLYLLFFFL